MNDAPFFRRCWCGSEEFDPFNADYAHCRKCKTLVLQRDVLPDDSKVVDDDSDFYGKKYWLEHQNQDLGYPDIHERARKDITERNLHWLKTLLKYRLPPASILELGCSHGSFVALMRQAGYDASGVEMSPWVVEYGRHVFNIPVSIGPVESLDIPVGSLDCVAMMDVLEHFPDPAKTIAHCLSLLNEDGFLLIQTPRYDHWLTHKDLTEANHPFLNQLKADEHIFLFSKDSVTDFFSKLGVENVSFEPAIFGAYDMFLLASRKEMTPISENEGTTALLDAPQGRVAQALLDLRDREIHLIDELRDSERDRLDRFEQIQALTELVHEYQSKHEEAEIKYTECMNERKSIKIIGGVLLDLLKKRIMQYFSR